MKEESFVTIHSRCICITGTATQQYRYCKRFKLFSDAWNDKNTKEHNISKTDPV
jgi:hypothetical protein